MYEVISQDISDIKASLASLKESVTSLDGRTAALETSLDNCSKEVDDIKKSLSAIVSDIDNLKEQLTKIVGSIQSIAVIPDYSDGSVHMTGMQNNELKFEMYPLDAAKQVADLGITALSLDYVPTQTKASSDFTSIPLKSVSYDNKVLTIIADGSSLPDEVLTGEQSISARLKVSTETVTKTSDFFALSFDLQRCVTLDAQVTSPVSVTLSGYSSKGIQNSITCGFEYSLSAESINSGFVSAAASNDSHSFTAALSGLAPNSTYYYRAFVLEGAKYHYGDIKQFTTSDYEYVDLGLSVKWATCNLGASSPYEDGDYYAWGELETKETYSDEYYDYYNLGGLTELPAEWDIATVTMGGNWRMPSQSELHELIDKCDITFVESTTEGQRPGYSIKSKVNGNVIFIPAAGIKDKTGLIYYNNCGIVWSSSYRIPLIMRSVYHFASLNNYINIQLSRPNGVPIRPVLGERKPALQSIELQPVTLKQNDNTIITAVLTPENASTDCLLWSIDDSNVAKISEDLSSDSGLYNSAIIIPRSVGTTTLRARSTDYTINASCTVTVEAIDISAPEIVDMGLSVKWATCNLGASKPEEGGVCCAWGGLEYGVERDGVLSYSSDSGKWIGSGGDNDLLGYCYDSSWGIVDNRGVLLPEDDVATVNLGDKWRMPTKKEWQELINNTSKSFKSDYNGTGITGWVLTSKVPDFTTSQIFVPSQLTGGFILPYWSSSVSPDNPYSYTCGFPEYYNSNPYVTQEDPIRLETRKRTNMGMIRPVYGERFPSVSGILINETTLAIKEGQDLRKILKATVSPENAANDEIGWFIKDESILVKKGDRIVAAREGKTTVTAKSVDGGFSASCEVTVVPVAFSYEYVDLGLSVKWATCNLGATNPVEDGLYYAWGETEPKASYELTNYKWYSDENNDGIWEWTKYNTPDAVLSAEDDAATVNLGDNWRIPTISEWEELATCGGREKVSDYQGTGVGGIIITSLYNDKSIFIPNSEIIGPLFGNPEWCPLLWSINSGPENAEHYAICFGGQYTRTIMPAPKNVLKSYGLPIRPVYVGE